MPFERTIGPGKIHASDATLLSPQANQAATPRLGSMLLPSATAPTVVEAPKPQNRPPSAWKRPLVMHQGRPVAPTHPPAIAAIERSLPSTRPPPPLSDPPPSLPKKRMPPWLAGVMGAGAVFLAAGLGLLLAPSSNKDSKPTAPAAAPPSVAAWTLEDAPGVSVNPVPELPLAAPPATTATATARAVPSSLASAMASAISNAQSRPPSPPKPVSSSAIQAGR